MPWVWSTRRLGWVGSLSWWVGLGRVAENGPMDNSVSVWFNVFIYYACPSVFYYIYLLFNFINQYLLQNSRYTVCNRKKRIEVEEILYFAGDKGSQLRLSERQQRCLSDSQDLRILLEVVTTETARNCLPRRPRQQTIPRTIMAQCLICHSNSKTCKRKDSSKLKNCVSRLNVRICSDSVANNDR